MTEHDENKRVIEIAHSMDWEDLTDRGSGSCVHSHGCAGVTQSDLYEFARRLMAEKSAAIRSLEAKLEEAVTERGLAVQALLHRLEAERKARVRAENRVENLDEHLSICTRFQEQLFERAEALQSRLAQIEAATIERCAKAAEEQRDCYKEPTQWDYGAQDGTYTCAKAIRALKPAAPQEDGQLCNAKGTPKAPESRPASAAAQGIGTYRTTSEPTPQSASTTAAATEPVAWKFRMDGIDQVLLDEDADIHVRRNGTPLYAAPPQDALDAKQELARHEQVAGFDLAMAKIDLWRDRWCEALSNTALLELDAAIDAAILKSEKSA